ncbi:STAS/SEC14 domain-containing protein [Halorussus halobius]|uniref:STAS/SEC14 domain-containing protein n=1 Tax=Halorussus halobius TaxID=1710537 RepID=UPI0010932CF2|nr:STAS/SEC14 domain-containing protein [Halorussus halobius]
MPREVLEDTADYTIEWDDDIDAVVHTWTDFTTGEEFRAGANSLLDAIEDQNASKLLIDTQNVKAHEDEDKAWLAEEWTPRIIEAGVRHSAQVHPDSVISKMEMENLGEEMDDVPYDHFLTSDVEEAREWLADQ